MDTLHVDLRACVILTMPSTAKNGGPDPESQTPLKNGTTVEEKAEEASCGSYSLIMLLMQFFRSFALFPLFIVLLNLSWKQSKICVISNFEVPIDFYLRTRDTIA